MKLPVIVPAVYEADLPRLRGKRLVVTAFETEVEIREVTEAEAPLGIFVVLDAPKRGTLYNVLDNALWKRGTLNRAEDRRSGAGTITAPVRAELWRQTLRELAAVPDTNILPVKARASIAENVEKMRLDALEEDFLETGRPPIRDDRYADAIDRWRWAARVAADRLVLIDGKLHKMAAGPCLRVTHSRRDLGLVSADNDDPHGKTRAEWLDGVFSKYIGPQSRHGYFSPDDAQGAVEFAAGHGYTLPTLAETVGRIEIAMSDLPLADMASLELDRMARLFSMDVGDNVARLSKNRAIMRRDDMREVYVGLIALNDVLRTSSGRTETADDLEAALTALLGSVRHHAERGVDFCRKMKMSSVDGALTRWRQSPIRIEPAADFARMPGR